MDSINQKKSDELLSLYMDRVSKITDYMNEKYKYLIKPKENECKRYMLITGLFLRALFWMKTLAKLDYSHDFQAIAACNRSLVEILVDMLILYNDKTDNSWKKMEAWGNSSKFHAAQKIVRFFKSNNLPVAPEYKSVEKYYQKKRDIINGMRIAFWPSLKGKHPVNRWTGSAKLEDDITFVEQKYQDFIKKYLEDTLKLYHIAEITRLNWYVHGSALVGLYNVHESAVDSANLKSYKDCGSLALLCTIIILSEFGYVRKNPNLEQEFEKFNVL